MVVLLGFMTTGGVSVAESAAMQTGENWPTVEGDDANTRYSPLSQINTSDVRELGGAWVRKFGSHSRSSPVVVNGVMYFSNATTIYALNAKTGKTLWAYTPAGSTPAWGGVAVADGKVFSGLVDTHVVALDAGTGKLLWTGFIGNAPSASGASQSPFGPQVASFNVNVGLLTSPPTYINGKVVFGLSGGDADVRCKIVALDASDGKMAWQWWVIPSPGQPGSDTWPAGIDYTRISGGAVWTRGAADPKLDLVYYGTGNPAPALGGEVRSGDNLYTASVVALDAKTGELKWYYQLSHHDLWENDVSTPIILFDSRFDGRERKALAVMRTDGYMFVLDRATGQPLVPVKERPVKQDHRLLTAPTQPFPVGTEQVGPNCVQRDEMLPGFVSSCFFDPQFYDAQDVLYPGANVREAPMSFDRKTGYFYVAAGVGAWRFRRLEDPYILAIYPAEQSKQYGLVTAISDRTHQIVWQKRSSWSLIASGGIMTTAGGLMFRMEGDGNFMAFNARTGLQLWKFQTGDLGGPTVDSLTSSAPSAAYEVDGQEYIAVPMGSSLWAFKLHGSIPERPAPPVPPTKYGFRGMVQLLGPGGEIAIAALQPTLLPGPAHYVDQASFTPSRATIPVGQPIKFMNHGVETHTVVATDHSWTTGPIAPGGSVTIAIKKPGNYTYFATQYPWSRGQLIVQ